MPRSPATCLPPSSSAGARKRARWASPASTPGCSCGPPSTRRKSSTARLPRPLRPRALSLRREGLAALSGLLLALSFPKFGHGAVAWVALTPLLVALAEAPSPRHGFRLGYVTGAVSSLGIVYWTSIVVVQFGGLALPLGVAVMGLLCLALALFPSLLGWMVSRWARTYGPAALLLAPVAWVATEILRAHTLFNFSWCLLGYSQHAQLPEIGRAHV